MAIKSNLDYDLPLKKTPKLCNMIPGVRSVFHRSVFQGDKFYR